MEIKINSIITLSNDEQYMVLNETIFENNHYFLVMGVDDNHEILSSKVEDSRLIIELTKLLKNQL